MTKKNKRRLKKYETLKEWKMIKEKGKNHWKSIKQNRRMKKILDPRMKEKNQRMKGL